VSRPCKQCFDACMKKNRDKGKDARNYCKKQCADKCGKGLIGGFRTMSIPWNKALPVVKRIIVWLAWTAAAAALTALVMWLGDVTTVLDATDWQRFGAYGGIAAAVAKFIIDELKQWQSEAAQHASDDNPRNG